MQKLRDDLELLRSFSSQHIIAALGVNFSPPLLAVELAPLGTLRDYLNTGKSLENIATHHLALQVSDGKRSSCISSCVHDYSGAQWYGVSG